MELKLGIHTYYISLCINYAFYSSPIRTLVAMATSIFHRFIKRKANIEDFFCLNGDIWNLFLQKCLLRSPLFHMAFVQIAEFDWLPGQQKGIF